MRYFMGNIDVSWDTVGHIANVCMVKANPGPHPCGMIHSQSEHIQIPIFCDMIVL